MVQCTLSFRTLRTLPPFFTQKKHLSRATLEHRLTRTLEHLEHSHTRTKEQLNT